MTPLTSAALACAIGYLAVCARPVSEVRSLLKTAAVLLLAISAGLQGGAWLLVAALTLCALGDWMLSRTGEGAFMAGIGAFATAHLVYVALFLSQPAADPGRWSQLPQVLILIGLLALGTAMAWLLWPRAGDLQGPVMAYVPIILAMGLAALALPPEGALRYALPAALLFVLSDLVLACEKFLLPEGHPLLRVTPYVIWSTYWLAQLGFLSAFA